MDGLRAVAVLSVVIYHAFPKFIRGGFIGVDIFFVISGFLISTIIFGSLERNSFNFIEFYSRRIKRIFPALLLVLTASFVFGWFALLADEYKQLGKHIAGGAGFISNFLFWKESGYFDNAAETKPLLHLWSLGIEEQFYIVWPLLLWLAWKKRFNLLTITILVAVISFALNISKVHSDAVAAFYSPQTRFWELLVGSVLAYMTMHRRSLSPKFKHKLDMWLGQIIYAQAPEANGKTLHNVQSLLGAFLILAGLLIITKERHFPGWWAVVPTLGALLIISAGVHSWFNRVVLSNRVLVWFGLISFPLYLWHWPLLSFVRIIESGTPSRQIRIAAVLISIALAWLTYKFIEKPIRFGKHGKAKTITLFLLMIAVSCAAYNGFKNDGFSQSHTYQKIIKRKGFEHAFGPSLSWYEGKQDWLFLGNSYDNTVAKLKLAIVPSDSEIEATKEIFSNISKVGAQSNTKVILIVGPNKSSIYSEYLPDELLPSTKKYSSFFLGNLKDVPNLTVYNPTDDLLNSKKNEGILYWMTDTHWNNKGAFLAYSGFSKLLGLPVPQVEFQHSSTHSGDLIGISKLKDFPLHAEDNWDVVWKNKPVWTENEIPDEQKTAFGSATVVSNQNPLSTKYVWVVGDSFTGALKQYFNATFKEVRYVGQWGDKLKNLPADLAKADKKPDMIIIVRVERSF
ncbi:MAG: acyltransferase family protein [Methylotenera sp.]|uniref:acyltransferase family protein n=2 Tax=Methylotenera sp. TaxID=2051956 RepID=UPI00272FA455|nr:acyltransferase family protein [Methylotenera sp.]MDP2071189.1 acyltransferase family protein [Methylotenera sp.]